MPRQQHLNSRVHVGQNIACPFCHCAYATATGLTHHLESGSCSAARGLNRDELYRIVRARDTHGAFTKNLIGWHGDGEYEVSDHSYNWARDAWECYLCHRLFGKRQSLNQHINSPARKLVSSLSLSQPHLTRPADQQKLYHCPGRSCTKEFTTLAAIVNHLESESCGCTRFATVQHSIQDMVRGERLLGF